MAASSTACGPGRFIFSKLSYLCSSKAKIPATFRPSALVSPLGSFSHCCVANSSRSRRSLLKISPLAPLFFLLVVLGVGILVLCFLGDTLPPAAVRAPEDEAAVAEVSTSKHRNTRLATLLLPAELLWEAIGRKAIRTRVVFGVWRMTALRALSAASTRNPLVSQKRRRRTGAMAASSPSIRRWTLISIPLDFEGVVTRLDDNDDEEDNEDDATPAQRSASASKAFFATAERRLLTCRKT